MTSALANIRLPDFATYLNVSKKKIKKIGLFFILMGVYERYTFFYFASYLNK